MGEDDAGSDARGLRGRWAALTTVAAVLVATTTVTVFAACNVHELGHAAVGTLLGWEVERVRLCLPAGGSVTYASVGTWAGGLQGWAGGLIAAAILVAVEWAAVWRPARPGRSPVWWAVGLGILLPVGPQLVIATLEGVAGPGEDYTAALAAGPVPVAATMVVVVGATVVLYVRRWPLGAVVL